MLAVEHAAALQLLASDPAIAATTRIPHPYPPGAALQFIEHQRKESAEGRAHVFVIKDRNEILGVCGLHDIVNGEARELGYWIGRQYWGKGYATFAVKMVLKFAFQNLGVTRIGSATLESNIASRRVLLKAGFNLLRVEPHRDPLLKRPEELQVVYEITRQQWLDFQAAPALASLPANLKRLLEMELAAGNEIYETSVGWPETDSLFIKLRHPFRARPVPLPPGVDYAEPRSAHGWSAEYSTRAPRHIIAS